MLLHNIFIYSPHKPERKWVTFYAPDLITSSEVAYNYYYSDFWSI